MRYADTGRTMLPALGFNNTFAILVRGADARARRLTRLSQLGAARAGVARRIRLRVPGTGGRLSRAGVSLRAEVQRRAPRHGPHADLPGARRRRGRCHRWRCNRGPHRRAWSCHPRGRPSSTFRLTRPCRSSTPRRCCAIREIASALSRVSGRVTSAEMRRMNYAVDGERRDPPWWSRRFLDALEGGV